MIKNVIFDIGNVMAKFRWYDYIREMGYSGDTADRIANATVKAKCWQSYDQGLITIDQMIESCVANDPEMEKEIRSFFIDRRRLVMEFDYSVDWICELKSRGYKVYLLSNYAEDLFKILCDNSEFHKHVDGMIISYREKLIKPDPAIYQVLLKRFSLVPEECVFLDDLTANVEAARGQGMNGIVFENYGQGRRELEKILCISSEK